MVTVYVVRIEKQFTPILEIRYNEFYNNNFHSFSMGHIKLHNFINAVCRMRSFDGKREEYNTNRNTKERYKRNSSIIVEFLQTQSCSEKQQNNWTCESGQRANFHYEKGKKVGNGKFQEIIGLEQSQAGSLSKNSQ